MDSAAPAPSGRRRAGPRTEAEGVLTVEAGERQARLIHHLTTTGVLAEPWRAAFEAVPRHLFLPGRVWRHTPAGHALVDRAVDPGAWWELAYADEPVVTQLDDGAPGGPGVATSSCSQPSVVARMLAALDVPDGGGVRVLEIGTGTGWNAALLAHRLGDAAVTTVDIDEDLAARARAVLENAGYRPRVVCGDGMAGWPAGGPYERIVATCSVATVPWAWVAQSRPGGRIVVPLHRERWSGGLVALTVGEDRSAAAGRWAGTAQFMPARADRLPAPVVDSATARSRSSGLDPARLTEPGFCAYAYARLPDIAMTCAPEEEGGVRVWLTGPDGAAATAAPTGEGGAEVWQYGPDDLWPRAEAAWKEYNALGAPGPGQFGITVTPGRQQVWLDEPGNTIG